MYRLAAMSTASQTDGQTDSMMQIADHAAVNQPWIG